MPFSNASSPVLRGDIPASVWEQSGCTDVAKQKGTETNIGLAGFPSVIDMETTVFISNKQNHSHGDVADLCGSMPFRG